MMKFLQNITKQFRSYKQLAERAMAQLDDAELLQAAEGDNNSIVIIVKHLHGNMLSRWTNFLSEDGEKAWRMRDEEFEHEVLSRSRLMQLWDEGWQRLLETLESLEESDLERTIHIRGEAATAMQAIIRQTMHYSYHIGQIILLCRQQKKGEWQSLSIPRKPRSS